MPLDMPALLARFGREARGDAVPLSGGEDNLNVRVPTDQGDVVVREYLNSDIDKVRAELALVEHLSRGGFPSPSPFAADDGEAAVVVGRRPVAVFPFVSGDVPSAMTAALAEQCGELLARMHALTDGWADERIPVIDRQGLLRQAASSEVDLAGADQWQEETRAFLKRHERDLALLAEQPGGPLHHDLHRQNLLVAGGQVTAVLDFDELNRGPLILDLARCFHYLAVEAPDRRLPTGLVDAAVAGYRRVRGLTPIELELLPVAFDLAGLVDASAFIMWAAPALGLSDVEECRSWLAYLRGRDALR